MSFDAKQLYELLPAIYRIRDAEQGEPLKALFEEAIAPLIATLEEDLAQAYDDQFIETCADWAVPYIGDLIGYRALHTVVPKVSSPRAEVANTIAYRRRKGTASSLEQLARDVTGWNARVVEFFQLLATTQYLNHLRLGNCYAPDLRKWEPLERLNTAFDTVAHTLDVRRVARNRGRYNIPNIGIFLWRLNSYFVPGKATSQKPTLTTARAIATHPGGYTFNPLGLDAPLFNPPLPEPEITHLAEPRNVPEPLHRRELYEELETLRQAMVDGKTAPKIYFDENSDYQPFHIVVDNQQIPPEKILICNLSDWQRPPSNKNYQPWQHPPIGNDYRRKPIDPSQPTQQKPIQVAVDPVLGRLSFPENETPETVEVSFAYGFSMDMGGGTYDRSESVLPLLPPLGQPVIWQVGVTKIQSANSPQLVQTLTEAINNWNLQAPGTVGIITIMDSRTYPETLPTIQIPVGSQLLIVAADWTEVDNPDIPGQRQRQNGQISPMQLRPHLIADLTVKGQAPDDPNAPDYSKAGTLILNGLLLEGQIKVLEGNLANLQVTHCTLVPAKGGCSVEATNPLLSLQLDHTICGSVRLPDHVPHLTVVSSMIDGSGGVAIAASGAETAVQTSTIFGSSNIRSLEASNSIFTGKVIAVLRQVGCVRFSSLPTDSQVPRPYRCQPNLALEKRAKELGKNVTSNLSQAEQDSIQFRLTPQFTSLRYGDPGYGQLSQRCAIEIRQGGDDEAEIGVFHNLYQPQRETNLRVRLDEYLRFGLEAGIIYAT